MVQFSEQHHSFDFPLAYIALAHNQRFPSPYATHVVSSDVLDRTFLPSSSGAVLRTTRLVLKRGTMPAWAPKRIADSVGTSWVIEESEVDLERADGRKEIRVRSRNIDHKTVMEVVEWQTFAPDPKTPKARTLATTVTRVTSEFGFWPLRKRIEKFGISRGAKSTEKARTGLALVASHLFSPHTSNLLLSSGPLSPFPFDDPPSTTLAELVRAAVARRRKQEEADWDEDGEPGRVWRERWRRAVRTGFGRFRGRVCELTGLLCVEKKEV